MPASMKFRFLTLTVGAYAAVWTYLCPISVCAEDLDDALAVATPARCAGHADAVLSPMDLAAMLERRIVSGEGVALPDADVPGWKVSKSSTSRLSGLANHLSGNIGPNCILFSNRGNYSLQNIMAHEASHLFALTVDELLVLFDFYSANYAPNYGELLQ